MYTLILILNKTLKLGEILMIKFKEKYQESHLCIYEYI